MFNRVDALEQRPDRAESMLSEYVRNFDTTKNALDTIVAQAKRQEQYFINALSDVEALVKNKQVVFDRDTIDGLEAFITKRTNFSLQRFVEQVQVKAIDAQFKQLHQAVATHTKQIDDHLAETDKKVAKLNRTLDVTKNHTRQIANMFYVVITFVLCAVLASISSIVSAFDKHPIITSILIVISIGALIYVLYRNYRLEKEDE